VTDRLDRWADPPLLVLASLAGEPKHGYAITQDVAETMGVRLSAGTLYAVIARLEARGLIEPLETDDRRRPYRITMAGAKALAQQSERMSKVASVARERLSTSLGWAGACVFDVSLALSALVAGFGGLPLWLLMLRRAWRERRPRDMVYLLLPLVAPAVYLAALIVTIKLLGRPNGVGPWWFLVVVLAGFAAAAAASSATITAPSPASTWRWSSPPRPSPRSAPRGAPAPHWRSRSRGDPGNPGGLDGGRGRRQGSR